MLRTSGDVRSEVLIPLNSGCGGQKGRQDVVLVNKDKVSHQTTSSRHTRGPSLLDETERSRE